jgi:exodeoxyribonuclease VII small subunit
VSDEAIPFERALQELEETVARMEAGNLTLSETLDLFERGMLLIRICGKQLDAAELRITELRRAMAEVFEEE